MIRVAVTAILVFVAIAAAGVGGFVTSSYRLAAETSRGPVPDLYEGIPRDEKLLQLDKEALDTAYRNHLARLFDVWLSDQAKDQTRVTNGLRNARRAYAIASEQIAKREREVEQKRNP